MGCAIRRPALPAVRSRGVPFWPGPVPVPVVLWHVGQEAEEVVERAPAAC